MFFRNERGGSHKRRDRTNFIDSVFGNIGIPLRVGGGEGLNAEGDEEVHRVELVRDQIVWSALHHEQFNRPPPRPDIVNSNEAERITAEREGEGEGIP